MSRGSVLAAMLTAFSLSLCLHLVRAEEKPAASDSPEAVAESIYKSFLVAHRPEVVWNALPRSYQNDVRELLQSFAKNMDQELYAESVKTLKRLTIVAKTHSKSFFKTRPISMFLENEDIKQKFAARWSEMTDVFAMIADSELGQLEKVADLDVDAYLKKYGHKISYWQLRWETYPLTDEQFRNWFNVKTKLVSRDGKDAVVNVDLGHESFDQEWTLVEGKWISKWMLACHEDELAAAKKFVQNLKFTPELKLACKSQLTVINDLLTILETSKDEAKSDAAADGLVSLMCPSCH